MAASRSSSKTPRRSSSGGGGLKKLSWITLAVVIAAYGWFLYPEWKGENLISEAEQKLLDITRENPNAEIFDVPQLQKKN